MQSSIPAPLNFIQEKLFSEICLESAHSERVKDLKNKLSCFASRDLISKVVRAKNKQIVGRSKDS